MKTSKVIQQIESFFLVVVAILTVIGAGKEIYLIIQKRDVGLQDLLLMFLYVEVLGMVAIYLDSKQIPITLPIFIAITAIARMAILQKEQEPIQLLYEGGTILMLALAAFLLNLRPRPLSLSLTKQGPRIEQDDEV